MINRWLYWRGLPLPGPKSLYAYTRMRVGDVSSRIIAELAPDLDLVSWRLNEVGQASFAMARSDGKATVTHLNFGNRILIEFDNGLPAWGGIVDPPRDWKADRTIGVRAYSGEYLLQWRQTGLERTFGEDGGTPGAVYQALIEDANAVRPTGIQVGDVWMGGAALGLEFHFTNLAEAIQKELLGGELSNCDYWIEPGEANGYIIFTAHLYEQRGMDKSDQVVLLEGHNISNIDFKEQGAIVNAWDVAAGGSTWDDTRAVAHTEDATSIAQYGFRQGFESIGNTGEAATAGELASTRLAETKQPRNRLRVDAVNLAPARFQDYDVGDTVRVILVNYGFDGLDTSFRVITREYHVKKGYCRLILDEIN